MDSASESRNHDGEPQPCHAGRGDASESTSENPKSCCDAADITRKRAPGGDEHRRAAKTRRQEGGRRTYGGSDSDGGDSGGVSEPTGNDEDSGSTGTHGKAAGGGSNKHGDAHAGSEARCNVVGGVESSHRGSDSEGADASGDHLARASEDKDHGAGTSSKGGAPDIDTRDHSPEVCATRRDEAATTHAGLATPGAGAEVTEEVASGEAAAEAATNGVSGTRRRARGKKRGGQQSKLTRRARKRNRKEPDKS